MFCLHLQYRRKAKQETSVKKLGLLPADQVLMTSVTFFFHPAVSSPLDGRIIIFWVTSWGCSFMWSTHSNRLFYNFELHLVRI
jgi:hypothetical protein